MGGKARGYEERVLPHYVIQWNCFLRSLEDCGSLACTRGIVSCGASRRIVDLHFILCCSRGISSVGSKVARVLSGPLEVHVQEGAVE